MFRPCKNCLFGFLGVAYFLFGGRTFLLCDLRGCVAAFADRVSYLQRCRLESATVHCGSNTATGHPRSKAPLSRRAHLSRRAGMSHPCAGA